MDNVTEWQHPYVDVFKKYDTFDAPKSYKGSVNIVHVSLQSFRIQSSPEKHSKYQAPYSPITQSQYQIQTAKSNILISLEDMYLFVYLSSMSNSSLPLKNISVFISKSESKTENLE